MDPEPLKDLKPLNLDSPHKHQSLTQTDPKKPAAAPPGADYEAAEPTLT